MPKTCKFCIDTTLSTAAAEPTTTTTAFDICGDNRCNEGYGQCRYVDAVTDAVHCSHGSWQYDCELRDNTDVFFCASTLLDDNSYVRPDAGDPAAHANDDAIAPPGV